MTTPKVSVIIPVYNGFPFIKESMQSILGQTLTDFELIIINDGSVDGTADVIKSFTDERIRVINNPSNKGIGVARNQGISIALGEYCAFLDADDISLPNRLEKQVRVLDHHGNIGLCGSWYKRFNHDQTMEIRLPLDSNILKSTLIFYNPFATSGIMIRKSVIDKYRLNFDTSYEMAEDYDLWERISQRTDVANLAESLVLYRIHQDQISVKMEGLKSESDWRIQYRMIQSLGIEPNDKEKSIHTDIGVNWAFEGTVKSIKLTHQWLEKLFRANLEKHIFPEPSFSEVLAERWKYSCLLGTTNGLFAFKTFYSSPLNKFARLNISTLIKFLIFACLRINWKTKSKFLK